MSGTSRETGYFGSSSSNDNESNTEKLQSAERENEELIAARFHLLLQIDAIRNENMKLDVKISEKKLELDAKRPIARRASGSNKYRKKKSSSPTSFHITNLSYKAEESDLQDYFRQFGEILFVQVNRDLETRKSKGSGFVDFKKLDFENFLERNHSILGRKVWLRHENGAGEIQTNFIEVSGNAFLHHNYNMTKSSLIDFFEKIAGGVVNVTLKSEPVPHALVEFEKSEMVDAVMEYSSYKIFNMWVFVARASIPNHQSQQKKGLVLSYPSVPQAEPDIA